jgi:hypothetical protein
MKRILMAIIIVLPVVALVSAFADNPIAGDKASALKKLEEIRTLLENPQNYPDLMTYRDEFEYETNERYYEFADEWNRLVESHGLQDDPKYKKRGYKESWSGKPW